MAFESVLPVMDAVHPERSAAARCSSVHSDATSQLRPVLKPPSRAGSCITYLCVAGGSPLLRLKVSTLSPASKLNNRSATSHSSSCNGCWAPLPPRLHSDSCGDPRITSSAGGDPIPLQIPLRAVCRLGKRIRISAQCLC